MSKRGFWQLKEMTDDALVGGLHALLRQSAHTEALVVAHLAEVEARRLHLRGAESLFAYCQRRLGLSKNEAFYRIVAARMGRKYPLVFELLERREIHLTSLALIVDYISAENHAELLHQISGKTKREILELIARRRPRPDAKNQVRRLPVQSNQVAAGPTGTLEPLSARSYCLQLNIGPEVEAKLTQAVNLMSHANPSRDLAVVVERALDLLIAKLRQRRFGELASAYGVSAANRTPAQNDRSSDAPGRESKFESGPEAPIGPREEDPREEDPRDRVERADPERYPCAPATAAVANRSGPALRAQPERDAREQDTREQDTREQDTREQGAREQDTREQDAGEHAREQAPREHAREHARAGESTPSTLVPDVGKAQGSWSRALRRAESESRAHIAHWIRRRLIARDGCECTFVLDDGTRCGAQAFLQIHHDAAWANGGPDELSNLRLVCGPHNRLLAEDEFGRSRSCGSAA